MADTIHLMCLLYGDKVDECFEIELKKSSTVASLRASVKKKNENALRRVDAMTLKIFKVSIHDDDDAALKAFVPQHDEEKGVFYLKPARELGEYFATQPAEDHIHIIVQRPPQPNGVNDRTGGNDTEEGDVITELTQRFKETLKKMNECDTPSKSAKSSGYKSFQARGEPIYDGRYPVNRRTDTRAPPVQLYHPLFSQFLDDIANEDFEVPTKVVQATSRFMYLSSAIYDNEEMRRSAILPELTKAISTAMPQVINHDKTMHDGMVTTKTLANTGHQLAALCIREDKNEIDDGGSDPSTQVGLSYGRFWAQNEAQVRDNTCCPTFLLATAGPWFAVLGAIWTDKIVIQRLTDYIWIGDNTVLNEPSIHRTAHILHAVGVNLGRLEAYYHSLKIQLRVPNKLHPRFFPSINAYGVSDEAIVKFTYIKPLERESICTTFLAETQELPSRPIVVKFVHRYNEEAHRLLADEDMAPKLLYFGKVGIRKGDPSYGHLSMVVMDYVDGTTADRVLDLPQSFEKQVLAILDRLHRRGYVFGDLRGPNIMVTKGAKVMLIDFDWVGKDSESTYPIIMSQFIQWPKGVGSGLGVMKKEHDLVMLRMLVPGSSVISSPLSEPDVLE